jgi:hypothetical protein
MMRTIPRVIAVLASSVIASSAADPVPSELLAKNSHVFSFDGGALSGPGWDVMKRETANSQYVLLGEGHDDKLTPIFAESVYRTLHRTYGFDRVALEQDPVAMELACAPERRGDPKAVAALAKRYPTLFEFASDQDLTFIANACAIGRAPNPVWGLEQALGSERYLEELEALAPSPAVKTMVSSVLADVRLVEKSRKDYSKFLHDDPQTQARLEALRSAFAAKPSSRAEFLLRGLVRSAEIFGYDRRAGQGEFVGLFNNTEREVEFKFHFRRQYGEAMKQGGPPKVLFKFGSWHMYRGRSPGTAFTIANHVHELAIFNGKDAYGILILPGETNWADLEAWLKPILPEVRPAQPTLIDLRALRGVQRLFRNLVEKADQGQIRDLMNAFDAIVILPDGPPASWALTGFPKLGG